MYYPDDLVEEIRVRNDIVDVVGSYVHLKRSGGNYTGLCPFHNEKTGSFSVNSQRQIFKCFGCGIGGNVYTFMMKYENCTFPEAVKMLADRVGVNLPEMEYSKEAKQLSDKKQQILNINKETAKYYFATLKSPQGELGYKYLTNRGLSDDTIKNFGLGFAPSGNNILYNYLKSLPDKYQDDILKESGIFTFSEKYGVKDKFWNRVIFPIMDVNNKVIAFGGRVMAAGAYEEGDRKIPKYLNSPETIVFDKSRNLYGLNIAKRTKADHFIVCEGYMDTITMHQAGFDQTIASLGTALTSLQATLMKRYKKKVILSYDSDDAGVNAALRAIPILKSVGLSVRVLNLSPYKDPDEFIKALGRDELEKRIAEAEGSFYYEIRMLERGYDLNDPESKTQFFTEIANKISKFEDEIERNNYSEAIAKKYGVEAASLNKLIAKQAMKTESIPEYVRPKTGIHEKKEKREDSLKSPQRVLLTWVCDEPAVYEKIKDYITPQDFSDDVYRKAAELLFDQIKENDINVAKIISCFTDEEEQISVSSLFQTPKEEMEESEKNRALKQLVLRIMEQSYENKARESSEDISSVMKMLEMKKKIEMVKESKW